MRDPLATARALTPKGALWPHPVTFSPLESRPDRCNAPEAQLLATRPGSIGLPTKYTPQGYMLFDNGGSQALLIRP